MNAAAAAIVGEHDFAAFQGAGRPVHSTVRRIISARWTEQTRDEPLIFDVSGTGFLRHMVRALVGTMVDIGLGRRPLPDLDMLLGLEHNQRTSPPAPPQGLYFVRAVYPEALFAAPEPRRGAVAPLA